MHMRPSIRTKTMELPLASVSDCKVRSVIRFLRACGKTAVEIYRRISAVYGKGCRMSKLMVCHYFAGKRFDTTEEMKAAVVNYVRNLDTEYCRTALQKLHKRYTKCLDLQGDYVEK